ncbi:MmgE/PrpD family protein [Pseudooceanicola sp. 216_PA32_1]|uniref:MmgE/PrpD family protein n=1 Tax=Pseudooceanicola pacificus TaxID=2676438 RepID=A0A844WBT4_9RHOB|nr:MmgE/PrpD family protein [Pseudooceanicola pacificus]MWB78348.1 MmgE/PrpD family protein [Pseudooceanicola pacificus]
MTQTGPGPSRLLAQFVLEATPPDEVLRFTALALKNALACAMAASGLASMRKMAAMAVRTPGRVPLAGAAGVADPLWAAWYTAAAANALDYDDTHIPSILHPTSPVAGAVLSAGIDRGRSGTELLSALAAGMEVACRFADVLSPQHYAAGWHITATCGVFGAAGGAARLLRLSPEQTEWAFGGAMTRASGFVGTLGTGAKSLGVGGAARDGLLAAMLAGEGLDGPADPLGLRFGFLDVLGNGAVHPEALVADLGVRWHMLDTALKPYPCGVVLNPVLDACIDLHADLAGRAEMIRAVELAGHPLLKTRTDRPAPTSGNMAQVSAQHAAAVALLTGRAGPEEFSDAAVADAAVRALGRKVSVLVDESHSLNGACVTVELSDGTRLSRQVEQARGSLGQPLTDSDIDAKLRLACGNELVAAPLIAACDAVKDAANLDALAAAMAGV